MAKVSDAEREKWSAIAQSLVANAGEKREAYDGMVREALKQMHEKMPTADDDTLISFTQSVAYLVRSIMNTKVDHLGTVLDAAFDTYSIATATLMGAYVPGETVADEGKLEDLLKESVKDEASADEAPITYGLYL